VIKTFDKKGPHAGKFSVKYKARDRFQNMAIKSVIPDMVKVGYRG
jgi:hypothetical protein